MCGIFGYVGPRVADALLVEGLKRLEYRGYDSWGLGLAHDGQVTVLRDAGRISAVEAAALKVDAACWGGIAHTRWATHGPPTAENAHPHADATGRIAVVHNGIIENHAALRAKLQSEGCRFNSETDSEVVPHLIAAFLREGHDFLSAFLDTLKVLEGTYGLAAVWAGQPGTILAARRGSPMVLGVGDGEMMLASDPSALVAHTRQVVYLDDGDATSLTADKFKTYDLDAVPIDKDVEQITFDLPDIQRGGHPHFMLKEICEQPESIRNCIRGRLMPDDGTVKLGGVDPAVLASAKRIHILACGTSWHAGLVGKYLMENLARVPTQVSYAAEFRYANPIVEPDTLVIAISQSGETADTLAGVREARQRGAQPIGLCNVVGSTIARECGQGVYLHAGPEIGVASTKAFTSQLVALTLLAIALGRGRGMSLEDGQRYLEAIAQLPKQAEAVLGCDEQVREIASQYRYASNALYVGRLYEYPVALEGALKLKEISYIHAEGVPAAELKHGPIALVEPQMPTVVVAAQSGTLGKIMGNVQEIRARGGVILAVARQDDQQVRALAEHTIAIPPAPDPLVPILAVIPLQLLAYHIAVARGCDVDRPRNLAKSVTVE